MKRSALTIGRAICCAAAVFFCADDARAMETPEGRVSRVIKELTLLPAGGPSHQAKVNDGVRAGTTLRTGAGARAEIILPGRVIARLGGGTLVEFAGGARDLDFREGLVLFQAPREVEPRKITTGEINVDIRGGTGMIERKGGAYVKILVLEGEARVYTSRLGESVVLEAGQLLIAKPDAQELPDPADYQIEHLYNTSQLTNSDFAPLPSRESIWSEIRKQKSDPQFAPTNLVIHGRGTVVNIIPPTGSVKPSPSPKSTFPSPGKSDKKR